MKPSLSPFPATSSGTTTKAASLLPTSVAPPATGPSDGTHYGEFAGLAPEAVFDAYQLEQLSFRRYNPLAILTAANLSNALDSFSCGFLMHAARLWEKIVERCETIGTVKAKREESVALREWDIAKEEDSPEADDQAAALKAFYKASRAGHAMNRHTVGGIPLLITQMMESVAYKFAVHHLIWQPDAEQRLTLPSGKLVPGLSVTAEQVPLEFFESRTGELRFLGMSLGYTGEMLAPNNWLVTTGPGLMQCASTLHYLKRIATHDLVAFSAKYGAPGILGHTTANKGSDQGNSMVTAVKNVAANYAGVLFGAQENKIEFLWPQGGAAGKELPCQVIREDIKRELAALWLGNDLSTISRGGEHSVGASLQGDSQVKRERSDCARISETLNATLDPIVIRWYFGANARILAKFRLSPPDDEDRATLLSAAQGMAGMGARVSVAETAKRLQVPLAEDDEAALTAPKSDPPKSTAINVDVREQSRKAEATANQLIGKLLARARQTWPEALARDLAPLRAALTRVLLSGDGQLFANAKALYDQIPMLGAEAIAANASSDELERILGTALANGLAASNGHSA